MRSSERFGLIRVSVLKDTAGWLLRLIFLACLSSGFADTDGKPHDEILFEDHFDKNSSFRWNLSYGERGGWSIRDGALIQAKDTSPHMATAAPLDFTTRCTSIHARLSRDSEKGYMSICWSISPATWGIRYEFVIFENAAVLRKHTNAPGAKVDMETAKLDFPKKQWADLAISQNDSGHIEVSWNGKIVLVWDDPAPFNFDGGISFCTYSNTQGRFDDVVIRGKGSFKDMKLSFVKGMPDILTPYIGEWAVEKGLLKTTGAMPECGWYLRAKNNYQIHKVGFRVRKDGENGIIFLRGHVWRLLLRKDELVLKLADLGRDEGGWWNSLSRPIRFPANEWHEVLVEFLLNDNAVRIHWDGAVIAEWKNPLSEWKGIGYDDCLANLYLNMGKAKDIVVLQSWKTGCAVSDFCLAGIETGKADDFGKAPVAYRPPIVYDNEFERIAPESPVEVEPKKDSAGNKTIPLIENTHSWNGHELRINTPMSAEFRIPAAGDYTLKLESDSMKNLAQVLEVTINDKVVSREVYRGLSPTWYCPLIKDYIPLRLKPGVYEMKISMNPSLEPRSGIFLHTIALAHGIEEPVYELSPKNPQPRIASVESSTEYELFGKTLLFRVKDLSPGDYSVELDFYEVLFDHPGKRLMDIYVNGALVEKDLDVVKEAGSTQKLLTRPFPATVKGDTLEVKLVGKNFQAFVNALRLKRKDDIILNYNAGWTPNGVGSAKFIPLGNISEQERRKMTYGIDADPGKMPPGAGINYFEGHNLLANPSFTFTEPKEMGKPIAWRSISEFEGKKNVKNCVFDGEMPGTGGYIVDSNVFHSAPSSLRVGKTTGKFGLTGTFSFVDYNKRQKFSAWVSTKGTKSKVHLEIHWLASDYFRRFEGKPMLKRLGIDKSQEVSGDTPWTLLEVNAKPPFGAIIAAKIIRTDDNNGNVWVDDALFEGYGAEPLEITCSHLGYDPESEKVVLVKARRKAPVSVMLLNEKGKTVLKREAEYLGEFRFPDRHYYKFDLTDFKIAGTYVIRAVQDRLTVKSQTFPIMRGVYQELTSRMLMSLYRKRINDEIPGCHEPDWLGDYMTHRMLPRFDFSGKATREAFNYLGGYYDAGDQMKCYVWYVSPIFAALNTALLAAPALQEGPGKDPWQELEWGLTALLKVQNPDGTIYSQLNRNYPDDGIPYCFTESLMSEKLASPQTCGIFAMAAYYLSGRNPVLSRACADAARKNYDYIYFAWKSSLEAAATNELESSGKTTARPQTSWDRLRFAPKALWASMYLSKLTGEERFAKEMAEHLDSLLIALKDKAYLRLEYAHTGYLNAETVVAFDYIWAPVWLLHEFPNHPRRNEIIAAIHAFAGEIERLSSYEPFGQAHALAPEEYGEAPRSPDGRATTYWSMLAYSLAFAGATLDEPALVTLGERQMQWLLGKNPYDISNVTGVGERWAMYGDMLYPKFEFVKTWKESGRKFFCCDTTVASCGLDTVTDGGITYNLSYLKGYIVGEPRGYMARLFPCTPYPVDPQIAEFFLPLHGDALSAMAAMAFALRKDE